LFKSIYSAVCLIPNPSAVTVRCTATELANIIIIDADDLGYGRLSCSNPTSACQTPRLDRMTNTTNIFATLASVVGHQLPDDVATDSFTI
jgi:hypothetical protein